MVLTPRTLTAGGLSLPLATAPDGPQVLGERGELEALTLALNSGVGGWMPELRAAVAAGEDAIRSPVAVTRPRPGIEYADARAIWRRHAGSDPGEDVYVVATTFSPAVVVPRDVLLELLDRLTELRGGARPADAPPAASAEPLLADGERAYFEELEQSARELDALAAGPRTEDTVAEEHAKRRSLLTALGANGFFDKSARHANRRRLEDGGLHTLAAYQRAAMDLLAYLDSAERREWLPGAAPAPSVLGAPVSVDWFRRPVTPQQGLSPYGWLAWAEAQFAAATLQPGSEGSFLVRQGGPWYRLRWRKDDAVTPALVRAEPA